MSYTEITMFNFHPTGLYTQVLVTLCHCS